MSANPGTKPPGDKNFGIASDFWLELDILPENRHDPKGPSLWLHAGKEWRYLELTKDNNFIAESVQAAFAAPDIFETAVWWDKEKIIGLVVRKRF